MQSLKTYFKHNFEISNQQPYLNLNDDKQSIQINGLLQLNKLVSSIDLKEVLTYIDNVEISRKCSENITGEVIVNLREVYYEINPNGKINLLFRPRKNDNNKAQGTFKNIKLNNIFIEVMLNTQNKTYSIQEVKQVVSLNLDKSPKVSQSELDQNFTKITRNNYTKGKAKTLYVQDYKGVELTQINDKLSPEMFKQLWNEIKTTLKNNNCKIYDVKSANILYDEKTGKFNLIDFFAKNPESPPHSYLKPSTAELAWFLQRPNIAKQDQQILMLQIYVYAHILCAIANILFKSPQITNQKELLISCAAELVQLGMQEEYAQSGPGSFIQLLMDICKLRHSSPTSK